MHCSLTVLALILLYHGHCFSDWLLSKVILTGFLHFVVESRDKIADCMRNNVSKYIMDQFATDSDGLVYFKGYTGDADVVRACVCVCI